LNICIFIKKKSREKATYFDIICRFFSLKGGDFSEDARLLTPRRRFFYIFFVKKIPSPRMKGKKKAEKHPLSFFKILLTYFHLTFDELCFFMKNEI